MDDQARLFSYIADLEIALVEYAHAYGLTPRARKTLNDRPDATAGLENHHAHTTASAPRGQAATKRGGPSPRIAAVSKPVA